MSGLRIGSLCSGYGGLELGVQAVYGGETAWVSDIDRGACKILAHRFPGVPNIGDMTAVDWTAVEPVDLICGGTPCQDLSHAGKRAGMTEGTRSNLWVAMREAIATIRPKYVVWENVGGAYSAQADSDLERDAGLLGDGPGRPALRALGRVLGDLASLGYDASWHGLRAADVGAPHGRFRVFVVATDAERGGRDGWAPVARRGQVGRVVAQGASAGALLPTPVADHSRGLASSTTDYSSLPNAVCALLPTPAVNDMGAGKTVEQWDAWTAKMKAAHGNGNGHGASLSIEAQRLLPSPTVADASSTCNSTATRHKMPPTGIHAGDTLTDSIRKPQNWAQYADAIHRWESLTRPAPEPTRPGRNGVPKLNDRFDEWLMGLPDGWITDVPGVTWNEALKLCGNGVVPQQAAAALAEMASWEVAA